MTRSNETPLNERAALGLQDAASYLGLGKSSIYVLLKDGQLSAFKVGKRRLIKRAVLDEFVARRAA
jgi:excisionase family DNA binding protein